MLKLFRFTVGMVGVTITSAILSLIWLLFFQDTAVPEPSFLLQSFFFIIVWLIYEPRRKKKYEQENAEIAKQFFDRHKRMGKPLRGGIYKIEDYPSHVNSRSARDFLDVLVLGLFAPFALIRYIVVLVREAREEAASQEPVKKVVSPPPLEGVEAAYGSKISALDADAVRLYHSLILELRDAPAREAELTPSIGEAFSRISDGRLKNWAYEYASSIMRGEAN